MAAENEIVWKPAIELRPLNSGETEKEIVLTVAVPGVDPKDFEIEATSDDIVIKSDIHHQHSENEGAVHSCEFVCGSMFRPSISQRESTLAE